MFSTPSVTIRLFATGNELLKRVLWLGGSDLTTRGSSLTWHADTSDTICFVSWHQLVTNDSVVLFCWWKLSFGESWGSLISLLFSRQCLPCNAMLLKLYTIANSLFLRVKLAHLWSQSLLPNQTFRVNSKFYAYGGLSQPRWIVNTCLLTAVESLAVHVSSMSDS